MALVYEADRDFYKLLGLQDPNNVTEQVVRQAYLKCARKAHPDRDRSNDAATENFQDLQQAYEVLKDDAKRQKYNRLRLETMRKEEARKREEDRKRANDEFHRGRNRRRGAGTAAQKQQFGPEKYFSHDWAPNPSNKPPPGAYSAWAEMGRANAGKFGETSSTQSRAQKQAPETKPRAPTSKTPRKPAAARAGSFAQWSKEQMMSDESPKNGYRPTSTTGDEPRAKSSSYASTPRTEIPRPPMPGGASDTDSDHIESILRGRPSAPYQKAFGEKTNPADRQPFAASSEEEGRGRRPTKETRTPDRPSRATANGDTNQANPNFGFPMNGQVNGAPPPIPPRNTFTSQTTEDLGSSWFVPKDPKINTFQFTAGSPDTGEPMLRRSRSSGIIGRKDSPSKRARATGESADRSPAVAESPSARFNPSDWTDIGPQAFIPRPNERTQVSPTRNIRPTLKKSTASRPTSTPRHATVSDETEEPTVNVNVKPAKPRNSGVGGVDSPLAMDIDSPPQTTSSTPTQAPRARAMPVEPSKPEWRAGKPGEARAKAAAAHHSPRSTLKPTTGGSEDTDEFRTTLHELKNVPPFVPSGTGLSSLGDLKSSLPHTSLPSENIPIKKAAKVPRVLDMPEPPTAPIFPAPLGANGIRPTPEILSAYRRAFDTYMSHWSLYNSAMVTHFRERQKHIAAAAAASAKDVVAEKQRIREQKEWSRQDREVRRRWATACDDHERRLEDHLTILEKMTI